MAKNTTDIIHNTQRELERLIYALGKKVVLDYFEEKLEKSPRREPSVALAESLLKQEALLVEKLQGQPEVQALLAKWLRVTLDEHLGQWQRERKRNFVDLATEVLNALDLPINHGCPDWAFEHKSDWYRASEDQLAGLGRMLYADEVSGEPTSAIIERWFNANYLIKFPQGWHPNL